MKATINVENDYQLLGKRVYKINVKISTSFNTSVCLKVYIIPAL